MYDSIIIGGGLAGAVAARELAEKKDKKVLILEQRDHIGGNCYDEKDEHGILIHKYGPHIFHTNSKKVFDYLSGFTKWIPYSHEVAGKVGEKYLPIPFNLNTLYMVYGEDKGDILRKELLAAYGEGARVPILELRKHVNKDIRDIADYVYENIFLNYTMKQWGKTPDEIDPFVSARVPVLISYDNRYFQDTYQGMPLDGYTKLVERILDYPGITVQLKTNAKELLTVDSQNGIVLYQNESFEGDIIFTGALDELFDCQFGQLPYRTLEFVLEHYDKEYYQSFGVVNYTVSEEFTRITEFKYLTGQRDAEGTTIMKEYPRPYRGTNGEIPYYAINNSENQALYEKYKTLVNPIPGFYLLGRLAEYQYYNMDAIVEKALELTENL